MTSLIATFGLLAIAVVLVMYGTMAKNRWGVNLDPVYCPRCNTRFPEFRKPRNLRQRVWGGWSCTCGVEVDKWGREIGFCEPPQGPATVEGAIAVQRSPRKSTVLTAIIYFCLTVLSKLPGLWRSKPVDSAEVLGVLSLAVLESILFSVLFYFVWTYWVERPLEKIRRRRDKTPL